MFEQLKVLEQLEHVSFAAWLLFVALFIAIYFIPGILALFFNPRHAGKIWLANIPAGFSFIAWGALILWAITGKKGKGKQEKKSLESHANT